VARQMGSPPIGYCSGWDDPAAVRTLALAWGVRPALDVEDGIRGDGPWVQPWLDACGTDLCGLYGGRAVHDGRHAAFHVLGEYPVDGDPYGASWNGTPRPSGPCAWQWAGTHSMWGQAVDESWMDEWFLLPVGTVIAPGGAAAMGVQALVPDRDNDPAYSRLHILKTDTPGWGPVVWSYWPGGEGQEEGQPTPLELNLGGWIKAGTLAAMMHRYAGDPVGWRRLKVSGQAADGKVWDKLIWLKSDNTAQQIHDWQEDDSVSPLAEVVAEVDQAAVKAAVQALAQATVKDWVDAEIKAEFEKVKAAL
jgi:hypothetical protein